MCLIDCLFCVKVIIGVPAIYLPYVKSIVPENVAVSAQNAWKVAKGAFTGETGLVLILKFLPLYCDFIVFDLAIILIRRETKLVA